MTVLDQAEGKVDTVVYRKKNHQSWLSDDYLYYMPELSLWYIGPNVGVNLGLYHEHG